MKSETDNTQSPAPQQQQQQQQQQQPSFAAGQWSNAHIPIDPALQQQPQQTPQYAHYPGYASHYPQAAYPHYQQYAPPQTSTPQPQSQPQMTQAAPVAVRQTNTSSSGMDTADIATLNDALGSAGVDLRAEEETLQRSHEQHQSYRSYEDRTRKQPLNPSFDARFLGATMRGIGTQHKVTKIPEDTVNYMALALRARLQELITAMIDAAHHRTDTQFDRPVSLYDDGTPMWRIVVRSDVAKQLAALERIEREEETKVRKERKERAEMAAAHAAALAAQAAGGTNAMNDGGYDDGDSANGGPKKKRKKDGPGVTARNMSEDVRKKMSNAVASQAAGLGGKYAWMNAANAAAAAPKVKAGTPSAPPVSGGVGPATTTVPAAGVGGAGSSWARPYVPTTKKSPEAEQAVEDDPRTAVTLRDAMFVVEKERGHGGGRGAARGWV